MRVKGLHLSPEVKQQANVLLLSGLTAAEVSRQLNIGPRSAERLKRALGGGTGASPAAAPPPAEPAPLPPSTERRLRDELTRARRERDEALREANGAEDLRRSVFGLVDPMPEPAFFPAPAGAEPSAETAILMASDWHWGERVDLAAMDGLNSYDVNIAGRRAARFFQASGDLATKHWTGPPPARLILILGGDMTSGEIHDELAKTNEALSIPAVKQCAGAIMAGIRLLLDRLPCPIDVINLPGNHGRSTRKPESKAAALTSYDTLLGDVLDLAFRDEPRVSFFSPVSGDAVFSIDGWTFLATHGDRIGSRGGMGFVGPAATAARGFKRVIADYAARGALIDFILCGHFHNALRLEEGWVNGCLVGPSEFARDGRFRPRPASQTFLAVHPRRGVTQVREIHVGSAEEGSLYEARPAAAPIRPRFRVPGISRAS